MSNGYYILRGIDVIGTVVFYTGKAGVGFVDGDSSKAFSYESLQGAQRKAGVLNRMDNGWHFMPMGYVIGHGIVPASALLEYIAA